MFRRRLYIEEAYLAFWYELKKNAFGENVGVFFMSCCLVASRFIDVFRPYIKVHTVALFEKFLHTFVRLLARGISRVLGSSCDRFLL